MNDSPPDALQRLILERIPELPRSYGDVARLCKLPRSTVHHLAPTATPGGFPPLPPWSASPRGSTCR